MKSANHDPAAIIYDDVVDLVEELDANCTAEELHGMAAGQIAAAKVNSDEAWLKTSAEFMDIDDSFCPAVARRELIALYRQLEVALKDPDLGFCLLLPSDDKEPVAVRAVALGRWCQGFLVGFGMAGVNRDMLGEELAGALKDIAAISQVRPDEADSEENEKSFVSLTEYVRIVVLNIFVLMIEKSRHASNSSGGETGQIH